MSLDPENPVEGELQGARFRDHASQPLHRIEETKAPVFGLPVTSPVHRFSRPLAQETSMSIYPHSTPAGNQGCGEGAEDGKRRASLGEPAVVGGRSRTPTQHDQRSAKGGSGAPKSSGLGNSAMFVRAGFS